MPALRILIVEDQVAEAERIGHQLRRSGFDVDWDCVSTETDYLISLGHAYDLVLAKDILPDFDARTALRGLKARDQDDLPFIVIADPTTQDLAQECLKMGATDYVVRDRLIRLEHIVNQALGRKQMLATIRQLERDLHQESGTPGHRSLDNEPISPGRQINQSTEPRQQKSPDEAPRTGRDEKFAECTAKLATSNFKLQQEMAERMRAEDELRQMMLQRDSILQTLDRRISDRTRDLAILYEVTSVAIEFVSLSTMLDRSLQKTLDALACDGGTIHLLNQQQTGMNLAAQQGLPQQLARQIETLPLTDSTWGQVVTKNEPLMIDDLAHNPFVPAAIKEVNFKALVAVPIRAKSNTLGVLSVLCASSRLLTPDEVELLGTIADQIGIAAESTRLRQRDEEGVVIEERHRLARELHDTVTQSLYSLALHADGGRAYAQAGNLARVEEYMNEVVVIAQQTLKEMRLLVYELRPDALDQEGLVGALRRRLEAVEQRTGVEAELIARQSVEIPQEVEESLYRIAQEALNNVLKHASASKVRVELWADEQQVKLMVADNGQGFDPRSTNGYGGMGLESMRERAKSLGAVLQVKSRPGGGSLILVSLPQASEESND